MCRAIRWAAIGTVALLLWGVVEPRTTLSRQAFDVALPRLPAVWDGARVAVIADLQFGMWLGNDAMVRRAVEEAIGLRPAALLIAGDLIYDWTEDDPDDMDEELEREEVAERQEAIQQAAMAVAPAPAAGIPVFAVLGNHDYGMMWPTSPRLPRVAEAVAAALNGVGVRVLRNQAASLGPDGREGGNADPLYIVGIDAHHPRRDDATAALRAVPADAPRVVFMHNPASFAAIPHGRAPLAIAAHTHGGQVRLPFLPRWSWMTLVKDEPVRADGWIEDYGAPGNRLYVNRGIGFSTLPLRINCPPELTVFTLRVAQPVRAAEESADDEDL